MIYTTVLLVHSWWRWAVMALLLVVVARAFAGWMRARSWSRLDERLHVLLVAAIDLQLLLGLTLYAVLSPFTRAFFENAALGMKQPALRFFGIEHIFGMVIAVVIIHVGRRRSRKAEGKLRQRRVWSTTLAALLVILTSIPWPFLRYRRPLFRTTAALVPPNPDDVESTARASICRTVPCTTSSGISGSFSTRPGVGVTRPVSRVRTHKTASSAPAAPRVWPMALLIEFTGGTTGNTCASALASIRSLKAVAVPCALT